MQAVAWSLPSTQSQALIMLVIGVVHLVVGTLPQMPAGVPAGWRWLILTTLLLASVPVTLTGLKWTRCGTWEGPSRWSLFWAALRPAQAQRRRGRFLSALHAQFWFEWRRFRMGFALDRGRHLLRDSTFHKGAHGYPGARGRL